MARRTPAQRVNFCVYDDDALVLEWLAAQRSVSASIRDLIRQDCFARGFSDRFASVSTSAPVAVHRTHEQRVSDAEDAAVLALAVAYGRAPVGITANADASTIDIAREAYADAMGVSIVDESDTDEADATEDAPVLPVGTTAAHVPAHLQKGNRLMAGALADFTDVAPTPPAKTPAPKSNASSDDMKARLAAMMSQ